MYADTGAAEDVEAGPFTLPDGNDEKGLLVRFPSRFYHGISF